MRVALATLNAKYIHKNLALRWLYVNRPTDSEVEIFEGVIRDDPEKLARRIVSFEPDVIGLSVYIFNSEETKKLIQVLCKWMPQVKIVLGGPEVTYHPNPWFDLSITAIVRGEGEEVFWQAIDGHWDLPGILTRKNQFTSVLQVDLKNLEGKESPYFLSVDLADINQRYLYMETSRGCPFRCAYCLSSAEDGMRYFSMDYLKTTFERLRSYDIRQVKFLDRTFNVRPENALVLAKQLASFSTSTSFHVELVGDTLSEPLKQFFLAQDPNRFRFEIGVQSFYLPTLKEVGRFSDIPTLKATIRQFSDAHMHQHTDLIAGLPFEDLTQFKDSMQQLFELYPYEIQVGILKLLHGTRLKKDAAIYGYVADDSAPYQLQESKWMSRDDIRQVELAAAAMEKCYNSQKLRDVLIELSKSKDTLIFDVLSEIGYALTELPRPYQVKEFFLVLISALCVHYDKITVESKCVHAYYQLSPICPVRLLDSAFTSEETKLFQSTIREECQKRNILIKHLRCERRDDLSKGSDVWMYPAQGKFRILFTLDRHGVLEGEQRYETDHRNT